MKNDKEVIHIPSFAVPVPQGISSLSALSEITRIQMDEMQKAFQNIASFQADIFVNSSLSKSIECLQKSIQKNTCFDKRTYR